MQLRNNTLTSPMQVLQDIIAKGGPERSEYTLLDQAFEKVIKGFKAGKVSNDEMQLLQDSFSGECLKTTLHGHVKTKPFGYAGDFLIIDKIYREQITPDDRFQKWDIFWNGLAACKAVRNRKDYFIRTITSHLQTNPAMQLLNVASGPARDLAELYETIQPQKLSTTCVEADSNAIEYAKALTQPFSDQIAFVHKNIFRFTAQQQFDVVWSAGLFDYFEDEVFVRLLSKFISWTKPGGEVIIGNFSTQNPSRDYMELLGEWYLHHRSAEELIAMAINAGAKKEDIRVGSELEGINLFLHIKV